MFLNSEFLRLSGRLDLTVRALSIKRSPNSCLRVLFVDGAAILTDNVLCRRFISVSGRFDCADEDRSRAVLVVLSFF